MLIPQHAWDRQLESVELQRSHGVPVERVAVVLRQRPGHLLPSIADVHAHFVDHCVAQQTWPEEIHQVDDFPRTSTGKVQEALLRKSIAEHQISETSAGPIQRRR